KAARNLTRTGLRGPVTIAPYARGRLDEGRALMVRTILTALALGAALAPMAEAAPKVPPYAHIYLIIEENHTFDQIIGKDYASNFNKLAKQYGLATNFYGERHPSEPNYIAMLGGDTFGIADDDAYWCKKGQAWSKNCDNAVIVDKPTNSNIPNP